MQFDLKSTRLSVFERVGQRFLGDPDQGLFPSRTDAKRLALHADFGLQWFGGCTFLDDLLQRVHERGRLRQYTRPQSLQCAPGLQQSLARQSASTLQSLNVFGKVPFSPRFYRTLHLPENPDQALGQGIVQVTRQTCSFLQNPLKPPPVQTPDTQTEQAGAESLKPPGLVEMRLQNNFQPCRLTLRSPDSIPVICHPPGIGNGPEANWCNRLPGECGIDPGMVEAIQ